MQNQAKRGKREKIIKIEETNKKWDIHINTTEISGRQYKE